MSPSRPVRRASVAGMTVALLTSTAIAAAPAMAGGPAPDQPPPEEVLEIEGAVVEEGDPEGEPQPLDAGVDEDAAVVIEQEPVYIDTLITIGLAGAYDTSGAHALLDRINEIRAEAAAEGITVDGVPVSGAPLEWSPELESVAQQRAAEVSFSFSHERPDGSGQLTALEGNGLEIEVLDENLALGEGTFASVESWYAEKQAYLDYLATELDTGNFARYATLISDDYHYVGIASFTLETLYEIDLEDPSLPLERSRAASVFDTEEGARTIPGMGYVAGTVGTGSTAVVALFSATPSGEAATYPDGPATIPVQVTPEYIVGSVEGPSTLVEGQSGQAVAHAVVGADPWGGSTTIQGDVSGSIDIGWSSSDEAVAVVDPAGTVTAVSPGTAVITATAGDLTIQGDVSGSIDIGWSSSDEAVAVVDPAGTVTAVSPGTAVITATAGDLMLGSFELTVEAAPPVPVSISPLDPVSTPSGTTPQLPSTVLAAMSDGTQAELPVEWDSMDPALYSAREGGSFQVTGRAQGWDEPVLAQVDVEPAQALSATSPDPVSTEAGTAPHEGGSFQVTGRAQGWDEPVLAQVDVEPAQALSATSPDPVSTEAGTAPQLPATVQVAWSNGETTDEPVEWGAVDPGLYAETGSFSVNGTVSSTDLTVSCPVEVYAAAPEPVSVATLDPIVIDEGAEPELPKTVEVTWSDGSVTTEAVAWEQVDPEILAEAGSHLLTGSVGKTGLTVSCELTVEAAPATPASATSPDPVTTEAGTAPQLPTTVKVTWSDGETIDEPVEWDAVDPKLYAEGGSFAVEGTACGLPVACTVTVAPAFVTGVATLSPITTPSGTAPALPGTVSAEMSNGTSRELPVTWDAVDPELYCARAGGSLVATGAAEGWEAPVEVEVVVEPAYIESVENPPAVSTVEAVAPVLPESLATTWSNGESDQAQVTWSAVEPSAYAQPGAFEVSGTLEGWDSPITCQVTVNAKSALSVEDPQPVQTEAGTAPVLPETVAVAWDNGSETQEPVAWDTVDPASYHNGGTFTVNGTVETAGLPAEVTVEVAPATPLSCAEAVASTPAGLVPELPSGLEVQWSNGDETTEPVSWPDHDAATYLVPGDVLVEGAFENPAVNLTAQATVVVTDPIIVGLETPAPITIVAGVRPVLPDETTATLSDGSTTVLPIAWSEIPASLYHSAGTFAVEGHVEGFDDPLAIQVDVTPALPQWVQSVYVTTTQRTAPILPDTVRVVWTNGETTQEPVAWRTISPTQYSRPGSFTVNGTAADQAVQATVTVVEGQVRPVAPDGEDIAPTADETPQQGPLVAWLAATGSALVASAAALIHRRRNRDL